MSVDFTSSALIGHVVSINLTGLLVKKGLASPGEMRDVFDDSLLLLESWQKAFRENDAAFEEARNFLEPFVRFYGQTNG